ncbi:type II and III secretion system protein family protein [Pseudothauera rhizosphaerae]|uniref:Type II and III secretion system protein family protein n=2 Tax=Pseudothauera rhizosphaerae TaxID=2565932 RepID=A0A4V3WBT3_9RHOO|nr:type II and III secretion system protein family protein [Pseudothauera rhizosphaerae]
MLVVAGIARAEGGAVETFAVEAGKQEVLVQPAPIVRWAIGDPELAGVMVLNARTLLITGKRTGATSLLVWGAGTAGSPARRYTLAVLPGGDGAGTLAPAPAGRELVLQGEAPSLEAHGRSRQLLARGGGEGATPLDASRSAFDGQVQIDIKVVEVSRQSLMDAAFFFGRNNRHGRLAALSGRGVLDSIESSNGGWTVKSATGFLSNQDAFNFAWGNAGAGLLATLSALEANGFAYTLAEPSLVALSGQTARFHAGGEIPIPLRTGSGDGSSVTIEYKEYGVRVALTPTVLDGERIWLKVAPEVSELDFVNGVQIGGFSVPGLTVRRTDTSLSLGNGESFVISGLISRNTLSQVDKFPGLGDLPLIGAFFRSTRFDRDDKELMMVVTAHLVRPLARDARMPPLPGAAEHEYKPSFFEMFFQTAPVAAQTTTDSATGE